MAERVDRLNVGQLKAVSFWQWIPFIIEAVDCRTRFGTGCNHSLDGHSAAFQPGRQLLKMMGPGCKM